MSASRNPIETVIDQMQFTVAIAELRNVCRFMVAWKKAGKVAPLDLGPLVDAVIAVDDLVMTLRERMGIKNESGRPPVSVEEAMAAIERARESGK